MLKRTWIAVLGSLAVGTACAADGGFLNDPKIRVGIGYDRIDVEVDSGAEFSSNGFEIFAGYEFNRYLALEAGYIDGGEDAQVMNGARVRLETTGAYGTVLGSLPIGDVFSVFGRAGILDYKARFTSAGTDDGQEPLFGLGAALLVEGALLRAEYRFAEIEDADLRTYTLTLAWRF